VNTNDEIEDLEEPDDSTTERPVVRHVVKDLNTAVRMKRVMAQAEAEARKAEARTELARVRAEERRRKQELEAEVAKIRLGMSAGEKARAHIAVAGPFYLLVLIGGFIGLLATGTIPEDQVSVASALLTLLVTMIGANLRSIISENGHDEEKPKKKREQPK
jgi:hypothetical protein